MSARKGSVFQPEFDASGLVTCVATDAATGDVLMVAHMNDEALRKTIATGEAWYFSRRATRCGARARPPDTPNAWSNCGWTAIEAPSQFTSNSMELPATTGRHSCFYRGGNRCRWRPAFPSLPYDADRLFDPAKIYRK